MYGIAYGGCTDTVVSLHWELTLGGTWIPCRTGDSNPRHISIAPGFSVGLSTRGAIPALSIHVAVGKAPHRRVQPAAWDVDLTDHHRQRRTQVIHIPSCRSYIRISSVAWSNPQQPPHMMAAPRPRQSKMMDDGAWRRADNSSAHNAARAARWWSQHG